MAFWGMNIAECDEFCTIYDHYMELYETGKEPTEITSFLLDKYKTEEEIPDNVYFAIAKAEWMLCAQSEFILDSVRKIIISEKNTDYLRSLDFSEEELDERSKYLSEFLNMLETPRRSVGKRRVSVCNRIKKLPKGTVGWYVSKGEYYGFIVLDAVYEGRLLGITEKMMREPETKEDILNYTAKTAIWLLLRNPQKGINEIGQVDIFGDYNGRAGVFICKPISFGSNVSFDIEECHVRGLCNFEKLKMIDLLDENNVKIEFYDEERAEIEKELVLSLMKNEYSRFASGVIKSALNF